MLKPLPVGFSTFRKIISGGYLYVDKTKWIYEMVKDPAGVYFISRPRRFGKSLLVSTLSELFAGNRELFEGLWIDQSDYQWERHPIIRIDFSLDAVQNAEELKYSIKRSINWIASQNQLTISEGKYYHQFRGHLSLEYHTLAR